ncbi:MAG: ABC transporter ATP-binding protein [Anaerolineaceae bacterium]|nr:MAG: ABC transporter ATP-binding protein [Anaerolineaceae bacterium]
MSKREFRLENEYHYNRSQPVRWIVSHVLRYPLLPLAAFLAAVLVSVVNSTTQILIGRAFDLIVQPDWETSALFMIALTVFLLAIASGFFSLVRNFSTEFIAQRFERDARDELYIDLLGKSQTFHGRQRIGDVMARATNDVRTLNIMFSPGLMLIFDSVLGIAIPVIMIAFLDVRLLLVPILFLIGFVITVWDYARQLNPVSAAMREQFGTMNAGLAETISGIEVVKSDAQEKQEEEKFVTDASLFRDHFVRQGEIQARYLPMLVFSVAWAGGFLLAALLWRAGEISSGTVVAYMGLLGILRFPTFISIFSFNLVQLGIASARRILDMINTETELDENEAGITQPINGKVIFENVSFGYNGSAVLNDISFTANPGDTIAIVGQTGSGKTTLTRLINRIFDTDQGRVLVDDVDVRDWNLESLRSQVSTIEQDVFLFSRTLAENVAFGCPDATPEAVEQAAREAQADDFIRSFKDGYETEVGERGVMLSGGQRQRIAIARAFLTDPRILVLDDSTSAIDSATEDQIQRAMRQISRQRTTFLITHRLSQIRWADRILVLKQGRLVDCGTHEELLSRSEDYQRIFARYE